MEQKVDTIFITGTGRSGTNILKKIMSGHSEIASLPFEYRFIIDPDGVIDFYNTYPVLWSPYRADKQLKQLSQFLQSLASQSDEKARRVAASKENDASGLSKSGPSYPGWELNEWIPGYDQLAGRLIDDIRSFKHPGIWPGTEEGVENNHMAFAPPLSKNELKPIIAKFINGCLNSIREKQGRSVFQEDNTHNLLMAKDLLDLVPTGKVVHIVRDPRDVLSSLKQQRWAPNELSQLIPWYKGVMNTWQSQRDQLGHDQYVEIRFEDLIAQPESVIKELCTFCGLGFEESMLDIDLSKHNSGRYAQDFSYEEIEMIESELEDYMREYDYT